MVYIIDRWKFKKARIDSKMSILDVYGATGITPSVISKIENGKVTNPSFTVIARLCKLFNIDINSVYDGELGLP